MRYLISVVCLTFLIISSLVWVIYPDILSPLGSLFYWLFLALALGYILSVKAPNQYIFYSAFVFTSVGAILDIINPNDFVSESTLKLGLVFWIIACIRLMFQYNLSQKKTNKS